jgi:hypothetical protein
MNRVFVFGVVAIATLATAVADAAPNHVVVIPACGLPIRLTL